MFSQERKLHEEHESELEKAKQHYKLEVEGLRSRCRMVTTVSMERSPSETSLEKFDVSLANYFTLIISLIPRFFLTLE